MNFHIGTVLSITHDRLLSPDMMEGVYKILNHMTGDNLYTHQLTRAHEPAKEAIFDQHPELRQIDISAVVNNDWQTWLNEQAQKYGEYFDIEPLKTWERKSPLLELAEIMQDINK